MLRSEQTPPPDAEEYHRGDRTQYKHLTKGTVNAFMSFGKAPVARTAASFEFTYTDPQNGQEYPEFRLPKRETLVLIAGYSVTMRARIIDRWQELESGAVVQVPQTLPEALRLAADLADQKAKAEAALALAAPKAAALDRISQATDGAVCLRVAAKLAQVPEKQFTSFLRQEDWIFRHHHSNTWQGYSDKERAGLLELKRTRVTRDDGSEKTVEQVLVTPKGLAKAAELIERKAPWLRKVGTPPPRQPEGAGVH